ncbi:hypothetical protein CVT25_009621 [Psilocybe cyanescens]|uniref:Uncharacterized protein n=1 Tax=Psilocybe cyanescens TaxID=93625 RepID=A0A409XGV5_PSICY|nr:hypothetical protein CVT25_009621 [Psilocybe cyanescens]
MAPQSILRNGMSMQSRTMLQKSGTSRSILKRPMPLPLSPLSQNASFSVLLSPTGKALKSAHVHFPPSPTQLVATFSTHGPKSYDRGPISVSPNPLNLPGWGERVFSPSVDGFRLSAVPRPFRTLSYQASPVITEFEDPRSPKLPAPVAAVGKENRNSLIRFAPFTSVQTSTRPSKSLGQSLSSYPRSPYPSAPNSPVTETETALDVDLEMETRGRQLSRKRDVNDNVTILSGPSRARARAASVEERRNKRNKKGLTLGGRISMNPVSNIIGNSQFTPGPSPLGRAVFSPAVASLNRPNKPAPLAMDSLTQAFWQSVSLEEPASADADEPMVTALEYPESAVEYEEKLDMTLRAAAQPPLMYAAADGALWSPALPVTGAKVDRIRESLMSPGVGKSFESKVVRRDFTAPSPNDPFAAFPSFAAALEKGAEQIRYPPRAAIELA